MCHCLVLHRVEVEVEVEVALLGWTAAAAAQQLTRITCGQMRDANSIEKAVYPWKAAQRPWARHEDQAFRSWSYEWVRGVKNIVKCKTILRERESGSLAKVALEGHRAS